jgi:hypothetical protein
VKLTNSIHVQVLLSLLVVDRADHEIKFLQSFVLGFVIYVYQIVSHVSITPSVRHNHAIIASLEDQALIHQTNVLALAVLALLNNLIVP